MTRTIASLLPSTERLLQAFGDRLRLMRLRRRLTARQIAARAGVTTKTLRALERGRPGVAMGAYLAVMYALGTEQDVALLAKEDILGRRLQDAALPRVARKSALPAISVYSRVSAALPKLSRPSTAVRTPRVVRSSGKIAPSRPPEDGWTSEALAALLK